MKRGNFIYCIVLAGFIISLFSLIDAQITGHASSQDQNVSIQVIRAPPSVSILRPNNGDTYIINDSILFNFSLSGEQAIWYNIDGNPNITILGPIYLNISEGSHTIILYANNTDGNITNDQTNFSVNNTLFTISYNKYKGSQKGASTDFEQESYEDLQSFALATIENSFYGKIIFLETINFTDDNSPNNRILDLDNATNISFNNIEVNSTEIPNFNVSAIVFLYGLSFTNPRPLIDGLVCTISICVENSYSGGNFSFNVTHFTIFSAEETPPSDPDDDSGGGSGSSPRLFSSEDIFILENNVVILELDQGEEGTGSVTIEILSNVDTIINISEQGLSHLLKPYPGSIEISAGHSKIITFSFSIPSDLEPDIYVGEIIFQSGDDFERLLVGIEVTSPDVLFDFEIDIPNLLKSISPGQNLFAVLTASNLGEEEVQVYLEYGIKDFQGNTISIFTEEVTISDDKEIKLEIETRPTIAAGDYIFFVEGEYEGQIAFAFDIFTVEHTGDTVPFPYTIFLAIGFIIVLVIVFVFVTTKRRKRQHSKTRKRTRKIKKRR